MRITIFLSTEGVNQQCRDFVQKIHSLIRGKIKGKEFPWMVNALDGYFVSIDMEDRYKKTLWFS